MKPLLALALMTLAANNIRAQVVINELMQSNIDCIMDDINEFPDSWVELYNAGTTAVDLADYSIGDSDKANKAWKLPNLQLEAGKHVVVYCDKEANGLHTDFRLESGKDGAVYLFKGENVADKVTGMKKQPAPNIAYGRKNDAADDWGYMLTPTPGNTNCGKTTKTILGQPVFSSTGMVSAETKSFKLSLSLPDGAPEGTVIRYTKDGTEPTESSTAYSNPINIRRTTVIRAKLFADGCLSPRSVAHSFIFHQREVTLPVVSIVTDKRYFYDPAIGIYVEGNKADGKENYNHDWRRPINLEVFENAEEESVINQLCETRIMGGATRGNKKKSLALYANKRFGEKRFKYEFFPEDRPGVTDFKSLALRNAGNDFDYLFQRDAIIQRNMARHTDLDWQAYRPAIVYVNGEYFGMLNFRERSNEDNIYTNYDGLEDIDMFENWYELKEGTWDNYNAFKDFYQEHGHTMEEYSKWMDCYEFINLMLMNLYYCNLDFPGNNIVMWRPRTDDGRWRWIAKDTDFGLGLYGRDVNYNTIEWIYNPDYDSNNNWANQYEHTRLFRRLMEDEDFKREFLDRAAIYMGDFLNERGTREVWDPMYEEIRFEYPHHRVLINQWWPNYNDELRNARTWLNKRTNVFYSQLANYYRLGRPTPMKIGTSLTDDERASVSISVNGVKLSKALFDGKFYKGRKLHLEASCIDGSKTVTGWKVTETTTTGKTEEKTIAIPTYDFDMPSCTKLVIEPILSESSSISLPTADDDNAPCYTIGGKRAKDNARGVIVKRGKKLFR